MIMTLYKKKYRVESARLKGHTYQEGIFFVTICTRRKLQWFGEIRNGKMHHSNLGKLVIDCWEKIPLHFPHVILDSFVVMPDHVHGVIRLENVETQNFASLQNPRFGPQSKNLASIIRGFKVGVKKEAIRLTLPEFTWQSRFHDHIVRSEKELHAIRRYIRSNPAKWDKETIPWQDDAYSYGL
jgi:putative transposase